MTHSAKSVLVAPLNWGLGHATRSVPVIRELISQQARVVIGSYGDSGKYLQNFFPQLEHVQLPGIQVRYPVHIPMSLSMLKQSSEILRAIRKEKELTDKIVAENKITHIISDNRYGVYSKDIPSVFISHQLKIKSTPFLKFMEPVLLHYNKKFISNFDELWIPDNPPHYSISGELSDTTGIDIAYKHLGTLSRFIGQKINAPEKKYHSIALISGPEPQRTAFEDLIGRYFNSIHEPCLIIRGKPSGENPKTLNHVALLNSISDQELLQILHPETTIWCRPGYSTLMDLATLKHTNAVFVPTPGQTEQIYLADKLNKDFHYSIANQNSDFKKTIAQKGLPLPENQVHILSDIINDFLNKN